MENQRVNVNDVTKTTPSYYHTEYLGCIYYVGAIGTGLLSFIASWIYVIGEIGFFLGVTFGWIPSLIVALIAGFLWPLLMVGVTVFVLLLLFVDQ